MRLLLQLIRTRVLFLVFLLTSIVFQCNSFAKDAEEIDFYHQKISAAEVNHILYSLAKDNKWMKLHVIGYSGKNQPILKVSINSSSQTEAKSKIKLMISTGQHGDEPSGTLAILEFLTKLCQTNNKQLLDNIDFVIIPLVNPDGWDKRTRENANGVNINADYVVLKTPEARAVVKTLNTESPDVVLDIHESSTAKSVLTGKQGYLTDIVSQFETSNNANAFEQIQTFSNETLLPAVIKEVFYHGSIAQKYQGAIVRLNQPLTGARSTICSLRNYASFHHTIPILLESKKDYQKRRFETPGNIIQRVKRQRIAISSVLDKLIFYKAGIIALTRTTQVPENNIIARVNYVLNDSQPLKYISLVNIQSGLKEIHEFPNWNKVVSAQIFKRPAGYVVTANEKQISQWLILHGIKFYQASNENWPVLSLRLKERQQVKEAGIGTRLVTILAFNEVKQQRKLNDKNIIVPLDQPLGILASLLLDPRSGYGLYETGYDGLTLGQEASILPLPQLK
ncbi:M14 family zinc carboxypeptidase [Lentisphaerota bacterium ZTH]|nr:hypothetical protein JYG24_11485 [Lentisphaerota bacterium]WET05888.1 M14 family zinc carboxypeptidase [Lentisphaerota bacterium ZTH]